MKGYLWNLLIGLDQFVTTLIGGFPDETLSSYAYRMELQGKPWGRARAWIDAVMGENHCRESWESERDRTQFPPELR